MTGNGKFFLDRLAGLSALFGVVSLLFYFVLRVAYVQFYSPLGIEPEDVGIGKTELISQALSGPVFFVTIFAIIYLFFILVLYGLHRSCIPVEKRQDHQFYVNGHHIKDLRIPVIEPVGIVIVGLIFVTFYCMFSGAKALANSVIQKGIPAHTSEVELPGIRVPLLQIWALPFKLESIEAGRIPPTLTVTDCMLYLGHSNSVTVVYDVKKQQVIRFARDDFTLVTINNDKLTENCLPN